MQSYDFVLVCIHWKKFVGCFKDKQGLVRHNCRYHIWVTVKNKRKQAVKKLKATSHQGIKPCGVNPSLGKVCVVHKADCWLISQSWAQLWAGFDLLLCYQVWCFSWLLFWFWEDSPCAFLQKALAFDADWTLQRCSKGECSCFLNTFWERFLYKATGYFSLGICVKFLLLFFLSKNKQFSLWVVTHLPFYQAISSLLCVPVIAVLNTTNN